MALRRFNRSGIRHSGTECWPDSPIRA
jgi:hypothetical protein